MAKNSLKEYYQISTAKSGMEALDFIKKHMVDLILLDIEMPQLDGIETLMHMKQDDMTSNIPVIFLTGLSSPDVEAKCLTLGARDFITKPFYQPAMLKRVQQVLELEELRNDLENQVLKKTQELEMLTVQTITTFANAIDAKDPYTKGHSLRVAQYSRMVAQRLGWSEYAIKNLFYTALLHDIGKIGIPDYILSKPTSLTQEEYNAIRKHPEIGCHILEDVILVPYLGVGALSHHERMDGKGYPSGLKGEQIPLIGRIICVADAVDAMMSDRAYRKKLPVEQVIHELRKHAGTQFDPTITEFMISVLESGSPVSEIEKIQPDVQNALLSKIVNQYVDFSNVDGLTGLWNRVYLEEKMDDYFKKSSAQSAVLMIDLDNFKQVNDVWGHVAGDSLLAGISVTINNMLVPGAIACRMGGDEFAIFIPGHTEDFAAEFADQFIWKIQKYMKSINSPFQVTVSIGIAVSPSDGASYQELYRNADKALYQAKNSIEKKYALYGEITAKAGCFGSEESIVDLSTLKNYLEEKAPPKGAYMVHHKEFKKIYQLFQRIALRSKERQQIILFTFVRKNQQPLSNSELTEKLKFLIIATKESLRVGDVATRFGISQYVILLKNSDPAIAELVAKRIVKHYSKMMFDSAVDLLYEVDNLNDFNSTNDEKAKI